MIELKAYGLEEFKKVLNISKRMWDERKEELLEYFKIFFKYRIEMKGRSYQFIIEEQYCEYEPLPKKSKMPELKKFYAEETDRIVAEKPLNSGSNVAREIMATNNKFNHKEETAATYVRQYLKVNYEISHKEWCKVNYETFSYDRISEEQKAYLFELFNKHVNSIVVVDILSDIEMGYVSKDQCYDCIRPYYLNALSDFKLKYGFRPYKAGYLMKNAISELEDEQNEINNNIQPFEF